MSNRDEFFGGVAPLTIREGIARRDPSPSQSALLAKVRTLQASVGVVRQHAVKYLSMDNEGQEAAAGAGDAMTETLRKALQIEEENTWVVRTLTMRPAMFNPGELRSAIEQFQALVPVVPTGRIASLAANREIGSRLVENLFARFERGEVDEAFVRNVLHGTAAVNKVTLPDGATVHECRALIDARFRDTGPHGDRGSWKIRGEGSESRVYTGGNGYVYKVAPIAERILDIPEIDGFDPLFPHSSAFPLVGENGRAPLLDRLEHMAQIPGLAMADLVGITESGDAIFKQIDLGEDEPEMDDLRRWALDTATNRTFPLPGQGLDLTGMFVTDTSEMPVLANVGDRSTGTRPVLLLDVNPRNSRVLPGGEVVVFDPVTRELSDSEVAAHPQVTAALGSILQADRDFAAVPPLPRVVGPVQSPAM